MYMITDSLTCRPQKNPPERGAAAALGAVLLGPHKAPGDPCGATRASRPRRECPRIARPALPLAGVTEDKPAAPAILHPQDSAKSQKKTHVDAARASRPRVCQTRPALPPGCPIRIQPAATAILHGLARRTAPQTEGIATRHRANRWPAGGPNRTLWGDVRFGPDFVCSTSNSRHSGQGWECLKLTQAV